MKQNQLKTLLKHIISEVNAQVAESHNYDDFDDPSNVASAIYDGLYKAPDLVKTEPDGSQVYRFSLHSPTGDKHAIKKDAAGHWWYLDSYSHNWKPADEYIKAKIADREHYKKTGERRDEMIANKDAEPDVMGAVNVEENYYDTDNPDDVTDKCNEGLFDFGKGDVKNKAKELFGKIKKITKISHPESNSEYFRIELDNATHTIRKDKSGKLSLGKDVDGKLKFDPVDEQSTSGGAGAFATPFAFKPTGGAGERRRKKKKKKVDESLDGLDMTMMAGALFSFYKAVENFVARHKARNQWLSQPITNQVVNAIIVDGQNQGEGIEPEYWQIVRHVIQEKIKDGTIKTNGDLKKVAVKIGQDVRKKLDQEKQGNPPRMNEGTFLQQVRDKIRGSVDTAKDITAEKTNPDGTYSNDMEDPMHMNKVHGLTETDNLDEITASGAVGQPGGMIQTPAWGTKNKLGSPRGIKGSESLGYKVVKSITNEGN